MSTFIRLKFSTAVIAALMAGVVLHGGVANAKNGNGGSGNRAVASSAPPDSAHRTLPVRCLACRFVDYGDKHGRDMSGHDKHHHGYDKHKKDRDDLACKGIAGCRPLPQPIGATGSIPRAPLPVPLGATGATTAPAPIPAGPVVRDHRPGGNASHVTVTSRHDTGVLDEVGGALKDAGGAIKDAAKATGGALKDAVESIEAPFAATATRQPAGAATR